MLEVDEVARLRASAAKCRELAETATDPETAEALRQTAADIEAVASILEEQHEDQTPQN